MENTIEILTTRFRVLQSTGGHADSQSLCDAGQIHGDTLSSLVGNSQMRDSKDMPAEDTQDRSTGTEGMRLWKVVTVVQSGNDRQLVVGLCSYVSQCVCGHYGICC